MHNEITHKWLVLEETLTLGLRMDCWGGTTCDLPPCGQSLSQSYLQICVPDMGTAGPQAHWPEKGVCGGVETKRERNKEKGGKLIYYL